MNETEAWDLFREARQAAEHGHHELTEAERAELAKFVKRGFSRDALDRERELDQVYEDAAYEEAVDDAIMDAIAGDS